MTGYHLHGIKIIQSTDPQEVEGEVARLLSLSIKTDGVSYDLDGDLKVSVRTHYDTYRKVAIQEPVYVQTLLHWVVDDPL